MNASSLVGFAVNRNPPAAGRMRNIHAMLAAILRAAFARFLSAIHDRWSGLGFRTRLLGAVWFLFLALVAGRLHGSSIRLSSQLWAPEESHFVTQPILSALGDKAEKYRSALNAMPRLARSDEWAISTIWSLAQFHHQPRFPVRNTNIGAGQNMLLVSVPVWHLSSIARAATWGYFLFGQQAGLAWAWWFSPFLCFTALFLCLEICYLATGCCRPWARSGSAPRPS